MTYYLAYDDENGVLLVEHVAIQQAVNYTPEMGEQMLAELAKTNPEVIYFEVEPAPLRNYSFFGHWDEDELVLDYVFVDLPDDALVHNAVSAMGTWEQGAWSDDATTRDWNAAWNDLKSEYEAETAEDDQSCVVCARAGRVFDPIKHDSENCWAKPVKKDV